MSYALLAQALHTTADHAKSYFATTYGAKNFRCEEEIEEDLPLRPTWQATMHGGYRLCIEVRETPFSPTLHQFVTTCATRGIPVRLWVALPASGAHQVKELKEARDLGVGVAQISDDGTAYEFQKPVPLSLFGLRKTVLSQVAKRRRESLKNAEDAFLNGSPEQGCQLICQDLEAVTRRFAHHTYKEGWWTPSGKGTKLQDRFFTVDPWATMLEQVDQRIIVAKVKAKSASFKKSLIAGARQYTDWRNSLSHKPKNLTELQARDARLRTTFESTRDLLLEWYEVAGALKVPDE